MSLATFSDVRNKARGKSSPKAKQDLKLSFTKLAASRDHQTLPGIPASLSNWSGL